MPSLELKIPPAALVTLTAALMGLCAWGLPALGWTGLQAAFALRLGGAVGLGMAGMSLTLWGVGAFSQAHTTVNPMKPEGASTFVSSGPYRFTRNPMYLGMLLLLCGWGLYLANGLALALPFAFLSYLNRFQIVPEERALSIRFGEEYELYRRRTRRWL